MTAGQGQEFRVKKKLSEKKHKRSNSEMWSRDGWVGTMNGELEKCSCTDHVKECAKIYRLFCFPLRQIAILLFD